MKFLLFGAVALIACDAPLDPRRLDIPESVDESRVVHPSVVLISVTPTNATAYPAGTIQYVATARDGQGRLLKAAAWRWSSSDTAVAVVSASGLATGRTIGQGVITATGYPPWRR